MSLLRPPFAGLSSSSSAPAASFRSILRTNSPSHIAPARLVRSRETESECSPFIPRPPFSAIALRPLSVTATVSLAEDPSSLSSATGPPPPYSPPVSQWNLERSHILFLNLTACLAAISAAWIFFSAIPALLAYRQAAESLEKLLDVTTEELPDAMAAVRLSGMEISDLTMELSDLGQEVTQSVTSSTRAVRRLTTTGPMIMVQEKSTQRNKGDEPKAAKTARKLREGIANTRAAFGVIFSLTQVSRWLIYSMTSRGGKKTSRNL